MKQFVKYGAVWGFSTHLLSTLLSPLFFEAAAKIEQIFSDLNRWTQPDAIMPTSGNPGVLGFSGQAMVTWKLIYFSLI